VGFAREDRSFSNARRFVRPSQVRDRNLVDIALLMAERHRFSDQDNDYDYDNDNHWARCSTCFDSIPMGLQADRRIHGMDRAAGRAR
jgi:hypothetical protein